MKALFESLGFTVMGEVGSCDITATAGEILVAVELKRTYSIRLLEQAVSRQSLVDLVYVGVPAGALSKNRKRRRTQDRLIRRLGLGLILVHDIQLARVVFHPQTVVPRLNRRKRETIITEMKARVLDSNIGGSTRQPVLTAYRQEAMMLTVLLADSGPCAPSDLRARGASERAGTILRDNHYGWFTRVRRGVYDLSEPGRTEPAALFPDVLAVLRNRVVSTDEPD